MTQLDPTADHKVCAGELMDAEAEIDPMVGHISHLEELMQGLIDSQESMSRALGMISEAIIELRGKTKRLSRMLEDHNHDVNGQVRVSIYTAEDI